MSKTTFITQDDKKTLKVERTFTASKSKVWAAYTQADKIAKWWGPNGWETEVKELNFSEGGQWLYAMYCKDSADTEWYGKSSCGKAVYEKIDAENSFSYTDYFTDENFEVMPGMPSSHTTLQFVETDGATTITNLTEYADEASLKQVIEMGMQEGLTQTLDRLEAFVTA